MIYRTNIERYLQSLRLDYRKVFVILLLLLPVSGLAQNELFDKDVSRSLAYLVKDAALLKQVSVQRNGIVLHAADEKGTVSPGTEILVSWKEASLWASYLPVLSLEKGLKFYREKGTSDRSMDMIRVITGGLPDDIDERPLYKKRIALDPGHFAHDFETAKLEKKYVRLRASDMGTASDIELYEAKLTAITAAILKDMLEELGATVLVTRTESTSATGKNFRDWYRDDFRNDLLKDLRAGFIDSAEYNEHLKNAPSEAKILRTFFKDHEFRVRAEKINCFQPDLTLIMHYNVDENNVPDKSGYHTPHDMNYSMVFVGGAYTANELVKPFDRMLFLHQLLSRDVEHSLQFSCAVEKSIVEKMEVPACNPSSGLKYIRDYCLAADGGCGGIYHRNLFLTRAVYGTLAFAEPLLQDNREEALKLSTYDCTWKGKKVPCRLVEMAEAYKSAILEYIQTAK